MNDGPVNPVGSPLDPFAGIELLDQEDLIRLVRSMMSNGVALTFHGKRSAKEISRKVRPRVMRREPRLHVGSPTEQSRNLLIEGENLQTMVTLYKYGARSISSSLIRLTTPGASATTINGTKIRTIPILGRSSRRKTDRGIQVDQGHDAAPSDDEGNVEANRRHRRFALMTTNCSI